MIKEQKDYYNHIRTKYKDEYCFESTPSLLKVYYELDRIKSSQMNQLYYAICNYVFLGLMPNKEIRESELWNTVKPYCDEEIENGIKYGDL